MTRFALALLVVALALSGCLGGPGPTDTDEGPADGGAGTGQATDGPPPQWSFTDTDGEVHSNGTSEGKPSVLFFMATWCSSCKALTREMAEVHGAYGDAVNYYSIGFDPYESDGDLDAWKERYDQPWPHGIDDGGEVSRTFGIRSQSSVVVLDADGHPVRSWGYGQARAETISDALDEAGA